MKRICIVFFVVLTAILQVNAQFPNDTAMAVKDTSIKVVNQQNNHKVTAKPSRKSAKSNVNTNKKGKEKDLSTKVVNDTVVPQKAAPANQENNQAGKPKKNWWQRLWSKSDDNNDCKQCESQLANVKKENKNLQKQVNDLKTKLGNTKAVMDIDDRDFYQSLIMAPLGKKYDSIQVDYYKKTVALFDYNSKKEMKLAYEVYYPLLENYGKFNKDVARLIQRVIKSFELLGIPDSETEKELFNKGWEETEYYKNYRHNEGFSYEIKYLEDVIEDTKLLFDNPSKFKKENFEEQLKKLGN